MIPERMRNGNAHSETEGDKPNSLPNSPVIGGYGPQTSLSRPPSGGSNTSSGGSTSRAGSSGRKKGQPKKVIRHNPNNSLPESQSPSSSPVESPPYASSNELEQNTGL